MTSFTEKEFKSVMKSVDNIQNAFSDDTKNEDVFKFLNEEFENLKVMLNKKDLKASVENTEKMDVVLKTKVTEKKKAKLFRIQVAEESRDVLTELLCSEMSNDIEINAQEFMRLLNEVEKAQNVSDPLNGLEQDDSTQDNCKKEEKKKKVANYKFIKRNIQLAKCGHGTLSLTEEEKLRIKNLLMDIEDSKVKNDEKLKEAEDLKTKMISENEKKLYAVDEETKIILNQIDQQLEMFAKEKKKPEENQNKISLLEKNGNKEMRSDEDEKKYPNKEKLKKKKSNRLKEINKLLNSMNSVSNEEIIPLSMKEIENLVQQCEKNLNLRRPLMTEEEWRRSSKPSEEVIAELVSSAKFLMPKFQYRFD